MKKISSFAVILLSILSLAVHAEDPKSLSWLKEVLKFDVEPGTEAVTGDFEFTNASEATVKITNVRTSCGCTTTKLDKKEYAPGESGKISTTMKMSGSTTRTKNVYVECEEGGESVRYALTISATAPRLVKLSPRMLYWRHDETDPKTVTVTNEIGEPLEIKSVEIIEDEGFSASSSPVPDSMDFMVIVNPTGKGAASSKLKVNVLYKGKESSHTVYLRRSNPPVTTQTQAATNETQEN